MRRKFEEEVRGSWGMKNRFGVDGDEIGSRVKGEGFGDTEKKNKCKLASYRSSS